MQFKKYIPLFLALAAMPAFAAQKTIMLSVPGMTCPVCPITVKKSLEKVSGVTAVKVELESHLATVTFDDTAASVEKLTKATAEAGYPSSVKEAAK